MAGAWIVLATLAAGVGLAGSLPARAEPPIPRVGLRPATSIERDDEPHLRNVRKLTAGGQNAEAYFSHAGRELIFQSTRGELACDQIFLMNADGSAQRQVSVGGGRTTCGYFQTDGSILYASTHAHGPGCLWEPDRSRGYVWPLHPEMDLWRADRDGANARLLFQSEGYDAEATVCPRDGRIVFTSTRSGDPELYVVDRHGSNLRQLTDTPGYDGGAFFSPDCSKLVWRASRPQGAELEEHRALLARHVVRPTRLEIFAADADGSNARQVTRNGAANFAPYMHPDNERILFASNQHDPSGRDFDLYLIHADGTGQERITYNPTFDGFPMWSPDGKRIAFASNRANAEPGETNAFVAEWVE
jgi:Tol biopolymer transport system component